MTCPRCQQDNPTHARFCLGCGARLALACGACGAELPGGARFCLQCGHAVAGGTAAPVRSPAPDSYTPKHLAEKILTSKAALEGERKQVTVLFADLKGSMELLADRDPEEARKLLDPVLERMMEAVHRYEGTVNQVMGDGIMALFGAPLAHEDHAVRACYAALRMQESVKRYAEDVRRVAGVPVSIRVGLNSGEVVVRAIGSDLHMDYTAVGQTTHLAARMEQAALPGSILISPDTLRLAEGYVYVKPLGPVPVKGLNDPVEVYEVTGAGAVRTRVQALAARGLTRFVGRDPELEQLRRAMTLAGEGHGQVVAVVGEAGVGKSRLYYEFTHSHRIQGWLILESGSFSYGKATSYLPVVDLLRTYFKIQDRDDHRDIREKVTGKLLTLDETLKPSLSAFLALLDALPEDQQWQMLQPLERRLRTLDAIKRLLLRESQMQPLLLIFEDLHWIDTETQALLDGLVETLPTARLLLLVNYRPEYQHGWANKTYYSQLRLDILPPQSTTELLDGLLGADPGLGPLKNLLLKRGNPFFLEETVRTLIETKAIVGERGGYRLTQRVQSLQVPPTVQAILAARIDRLLVEEKQLLQAAAVVGKDVPYALLYPIAELSEESVRQGLAHLQAAEFLYETRLFPDLEYSFKHALTHEVTYGGLLQQRRSTLHARIVEVMESLYQDRLAEHIERLAHHAVRGELWARAVQYLRQAGAKAAAHSANREAVGYLEQALEVLGHLPESRDRVEEGIDIRLDLRTCLLQLGEQARIKVHLEKAEMAAELLGDERRLARISHYMVIQCIGAAEYAEGIRVGERALAIGRKLADLSLEAPANAYLGLVYSTIGEYRRAVVFLERNVQSLQGDLIWQRFGQAAIVSSFSGHTLARCLGELGEFGPAIARAEEALRIAEAADQPWTLGFARLDAARVFLRQGALERAIVVLEHGLELSQARQIPAMRPWFESGLGLAYALSGRIAEGLHLAERGANKEFWPGSFWHSLGVLNLGAVHLLAGHIETADEVLQRALNFSREKKERAQEAYALRFLADLASQRSTPEREEVRRRYRQAMTLADELGMRPLIAHCHAGLAKLDQRTGKREEAKEHFTTATTMYREMDMRYWLAQAEAEMQELG